MTRGARRFRAPVGRSALVVLLVATSAAVSGTPAPAGATETERLAGADRFSTGVAVSEHAFPSGAGTVYLARSDAFPDALAAGALTGGPVLLVPLGGAVPAVVTSEIERLDPDLVVALGGTSAVSDSTLDSAAGGRPTERLSGSDRYQTAIDISQFGFEAADAVYLARGDGFADALAAGALTGGPILLVPPDGTIPSGVADEIARLEPQQVVALGGASGVPDSTLATLGAGRTTNRLAGDDRFATAVRISQFGFPDGADAVHIARSDAFADALTAGALSGGPLLLVPSTGAVPAAVIDEIVRLGPDLVIALGGPNAVSDEVLAQLGADSDPGEPDEGEPPAGEPPAEDPDEGESPDAPDAPPGGAETDGGGGGVEGESEGEEAEPPPPGMPAEPYALNVAEAAGVSVAPLPAGAESTVLTNRGQRPFALPLPTAEPSSAGDSGSKSYLRLAQSNFPVWKWGRLPYNDLPTAVGRLFISFDAVTWYGACTATVVGRSQIITAAHCFYIEGHPVPYYGFVPDYFGNQARYGAWVSTIESAWRDSHYTDGAQQWYADYGIIKLRPNERGQYIGDVVRPMTMYADGDEYTSNRFTIGYPAEGIYDAKHAAYSSHAQCTDDYCLPYYCWSPPALQYRWTPSGRYKSIGFGCYGNGGWSGGPVFQYSGGRYYLVSVVSTGGNIITYSCETGTCRWYGRNSWGPVFRYDRLVGVWNGAQ